MNTSSEENALVNPQVSIRLQLAGLWIAAVFCYIYADILAFYDDYLINQILKGNLGPWPSTQGLKFGIGIFMSIPAIMVYICLKLEPKKCRLINISTGILFTVVSLITAVMSPYYYYMYFGILEVLMTGYVVCLAWKWPTIGQI